MLDARFTVNGIFTTPVASGLYPWEATFTPYNPGKGTVNAAGTFEARAFVGVPVVIGVTKTYIAKTNTWRLSGKVTEGGLPVAGLAVRIARGTSPSRLTQQSSTRTSTSGVFKTAGHLKPQRTTYFRVNASAAERDYAAGCANPIPAIAPAGCVSAKLSAWKAQSGLVVIKAKPPKKKR